MTLVPLTQDISNLKSLCCTCAHYIGTLIQVALAHMCPAHAGRLGIGPRTQGEASEGQGEASEGQGEATEGQGEAEDFTVT